MPNSPVRACAALCLLAAALLAGCATLFPSSRLPEQAAPDARVTVQGRPVKLRPDGSFTMRFFLPDGEQVLEVHATNRDGDIERKITPIVNKRTK